MPKPPTDDARLHAVRGAFMRALDRYVDAFGANQARSALMGLAVAIESVYGLDPPAEIEE